MNKNKIIITAVLFIIGVSLVFLTLSWLTNNKRSGNDSLIRNIPKEKQRPCVVNEVITDCVCEGTIELIDYSVRICRDVK